MSKVTFSTGPRENGYRSFEFKVSIDRTLVVVMRASVGDSELHAGFTLHELRAIAKVFDSALEYGERLERQMDGKPELDEQLAKLPKVNQ